MHIIVFLKIIVCLMLGSRNFYQNKNKLFFQHIQYSLFSTHNAFFPPYLKGIVLLTVYHGHHQLLPCEQKDFCEELNSCLI